jgi:hypothetical protein
VSGSQEWEMKWIYRKLEPEMRETFQVLDLALFSRFWIKKAKGFARKQIL